MTDDRRVRPASPEEADEIQAVGRASWHAAYDDILGPETVDERIDEWWALDGLREAARDDDHVFLVAERDELVGVAHATPDDDRPGVYGIGRLYVHPDRWGEGVGSALVDGVVERVPDGTERLRLVVLAENEVGVSFYESYGFECVGEREEQADAEHAELVYELPLRDE